jgi:hypothetical protein
MNEKIFESHKPELADRFKRNVHCTLGQIAEALGPELNGVFNDWNWAKAYNNVVHPFIVGKHAEEKTINEVKLEAAASKYADMVVENWKKKITEKIGMLDEGRVHHLDGCRFCITGTKAGQKVLINQDMIINVSGKGTLFNQFPARIHLNGKSISAAKFKKAF